MVFFRMKYTTDKDNKNNRHLKKECTNLVSDDIILLSGGNSIVSDGIIPRISRIILVSGENIPLLDKKITVSVENILVPVRTILVSSENIPRIYGIIHGSDKRII